MNENRRIELFYLATGWSVWAERGPYRETKFVREVRLQSHKLYRLVTHRDVRPSYSELLGLKTPSKQLRKRRGKAHARAEIQYRKLLGCVAQSVKAAIEHEIKRPLTKAEVRKHMALVQERIDRVTKVLKEKYPIESDTGEALR
jgi:hypothetical protein